MRRFVPLLKMLIFFLLLELAILSKHYNVLYQSLIPNCKLTIKILRHHFTITDQVEQYILSGDSRRLCCQRVMNVLLVHLDIVKDHHQFCDWFDSVSVMGSLIDKIKTGNQEYMYPMFFTHIKNNCYMQKLSTIHSLCWVHAHPSLLAYSLRGGGAGQRVRGPGQL